MSSALFSSSYAFFCLPYVFYVLTFVTPVKKVLLQSLYMHQLLCSRGFSQEKTSSSHSTCSKHFTVLPKTWFMIPTLSCITLAPLTYLDTCIPVNLSTNILSEQQPRASTRLDLHPPWGGGEWRPFRHGGHGAQRQRFLQRQLTQRLHAVPRQRHVGPTDQRRTRTWVTLICLIEAPDFIIDPYLEVL